jgi:hypothetical protein
MLVRTQAHEANQENLTCGYIDGCMLTSCAFSADAKYVHFFLEKIPSRAMEHNTPLDPLNDILSSMLIEQHAPPLRTRALVQIFKRQWEGAILDLTSALRITEGVRLSHKPDQQQLELASRMREEQETWSKGHRDWKTVPQLKDEDQPTSLEKQLLFNRAGVYLALACQSVHVALDGLKEYQTAQDNGETNGAEAQAQEVRLDARKRVKGYAKKAIKDYMAFLGHFDYTPGLPFEVTNEIMRRVYDLANGNKTKTPLPKDRLVEVNGSDDDSSHESSVDGSGGNANGSALVKHTKLKVEPFDIGEDGWPRFPTPKIYPSSALFSERPLPDLPVFSDPDTDGIPKAREPVNDALGSREAVTYHPLLIDALHSLLLAHALVQTSPTEHLRHAHNAARLVRIADGYPIFQSARSPARADWIEVLRRANNWIGLSMPWQRLCAPAPLPDAAGGWARESSPSMHTMSTSATDLALATVAKRVTSLKPQEGREETPDQKRERIKQESIIDALSDDRVVDEESFQRAVRARERRAMEDEEGLSGPLKDKELPALESTAGNANRDGSGSKGGSQDEAEKDYIISTERAEAIARWIREAPLSVGGKKKRPTKKKTPVKTGRSTPANGVNGAAEALSGLSVNGAA